MTLDVLQKFLFRNKGFFEGFANLFLPQGNKLIERVNVLRRLD
jgi:hypothetical protein